MDNNNYSNSYPFGPQDDKQHHGGPSTSGMPPRKDMPVAGESLPPYSDHFSAPESWQSPAEQPGSSTAEVSQVRPVPPPPLPERQTTRATINSDTAAVEPVRIALLDPAQLSSGFTLAIPDRARRLTTKREFDGEQWTRFIRELNDTLKKAPGAVTKGISSFWIVSTVTIGLSVLGTKMHEDSVERKARGVVESWNRLVFNSWGIHVRIDTVQPDVSELPSSSSWWVERYRDSNGVPMDKSKPKPTLALIIDRF
ncbi:hypothetical protein GGI12_004265 [Dipsacomyces acuminosporus]|nr:hypothetical protein GGI12_004265 [Dipsacomyces acuminosporus]